MTATPNHALQRTAPRVTVAAISSSDPSRPSVALSYARCRFLRSTTQLPRHAPPSLSLGSLGRNFSRTPMFNHQIMKTLPSMIGMLSVILFTGCVSTHHTTWEYRVIEARPAVPMAEAMNNAARDGWEVVTIAFGNAGEGYTVLRRAKR